MKKFLLTMIFVSLFIVGGKVEALVFEYNNQVHVITERENPCGKADEMEFMGYSPNGDLYFDFDGETKKVTKDNKCLLLTTEDKFLVTQLKRYRYELEVDDNEDLVINRYDNRYEEAYFQTQDTVKDSKKTYYTYDEDNGEMIEFFGTAFNRIDTYYEAGYVTMIDSTEEEKNVVYYSRFGNDAPNGKFVFNKTDDFDKEYLLDYYVVNNDVLEPEKVAELNKEAFDKIINDMSESYIEIVNILDNYFVSIEDENGDQYIYDIEGKLLAKNGLVYPIVEGLYMIFDSENEPGIYDAKGNLIIEVKDYAVILEVYFSDYKGIMLGIKDLDEIEQMELLEHRVYDIIKGENQKFDGKDLSFTISGDYSLFDKILVDGKEVDSKNYTVESGSTIITLKESYLKTLSIGNHTLRVEYNDGGYVETTFETAKVITNPPTYDNLGTSMLIGIVSLLGLLGSAVYFRKTNKVSL